MRGVQAFLGTIVVLAAAMLVATVATPAADQGSGPADPILPHAEIVGTWEATVDRGPALPPLTSLHTFSSDVGESPAGFAKGVCPFSFQRTSTATRDVPG